MIQKITSRTIFILLNLPHLWTFRVINIFKFLLASSLFFLWSLFINKLIGKDDLMC